MKKLIVAGVEKPEFLSDVTIKDRPEIKLLSLPGKGDPSETFNRKVSKIYGLLEEKRVQAGHTLGIFYQDRRKVGVKNETWDACVSVDKKIKTRRDIEYQVLPEAKVIIVTLTGGYDLIGPSLNYLERVAKANNIEVSWPLTEIYIEEGEKPITELQYLIKK